MKMPAEHFDQAWIEAGMAVDSLLYTQMKNIFFRASLLMLDDAFGGVDCKQADTSKGGCPNAEIGRVLDEAADTVWKYEGLCK